jgi:hypothetical protein
VELLAAVAAEEVVAADVLQHAVGGLAEDGVAGEVAEGVVDLLEVVVLAEAVASASMILIPRIRVLVPACYRYRSPLQ